MSIEQGPRTAVETLRQDYLARPATFGVVGRVASAVDKYSPVMMMRLKAVFDQATTVKLLDPVLVEEFGTEGTLQLKDQVFAVCSNPQHPLIAAFPDKVVERARKWASSNREDLSGQIVVQVEEERRVERSLALALHRVTQEPWSKRSQVSGRPMGPGSHEMRVASAPVRIIKGQEVSVPGQRRKRKRNKTTRNH